MANLRIPDEFGIVSENARRREVFAEYIERRAEEYIASPAVQDRIKREVTARLKAEVDAIIERKAREQAAEIEGLMQPAGPPIGEVLLLVSDVTGRSVPDLVGPRRTRSLAWPRFLAVHILVKVRPDLSLPAIGKALGKRDHSTVIHARDKFHEIKHIDPFPRWLSDPRVMAMLADAPTVERPASKPFSKLTPEQARAIRFSGKSERELAAEYGISAGHAGDVKRGKSWKQAA